MDRSKIAQAEASNGSSFLQKKEPDKIRSLCHDGSVEKIGIAFDKGTLILHGLPESLGEELPDTRWDPRTRCFRAPALAYRRLIETLRERDLAHEDEARAFAPLPISLKQSLSPRPYQEEAMTAWSNQDSRGTVILPTGSGKTLVAAWLIARTQRPTLVHVPTIDLMHQWHQVLSDLFDLSIGLLGGGEKAIEPVTVATYDSALIHLAQQGNRFGMLVFDECHHLPGDQFQHCALGSIAPFRLGLTATPERDDGRDQLLDTLTGPICYRASIGELEGNTLSPYQVETVEIDMTEDEREQYDEARGRYIDFLRSSNINMSHPQGWRHFLFQTSQSPTGREAFKAYRLQKKLSQAASAKEAQVWRLLQKHHEDRIILFTQDNEMAYRLGRAFLLPVLTHQTKPKEREAFLSAFREGRYRMLVTSKVLNEGVDVPEANVANIVSGSGRVREHVQRLGRILRARPGKEAMLYELISRNTGEQYVNQRRRQHDAYQKSGSNQSEG
ncbi:MAG: DEAD/DEAH box helicase family protein [Verrucomicrobiota bacterium]